MKWWGWQIQIPSSRGGESACMFSFAKYCLKAYQNTSFCCSHLWEHGRGIGPFLGICFLKVKERNEQIVWSDFMLLLWEWSREDEETVVWRKQWCRVSSCRRHLWGGAIWAGLPWSGKDDPGGRRNMSQRPEPWAWVDSKKSCVAREEANSEEPTTQGRQWSDLKFPGSMVRTWGLF